MALAGDELYTIQFNHEWRRIVASALQYYFKHYENELGLDNEDLLNNVLIDLYNAETYMSRHWRASTFNIGANRNTASLTPVLVTGSTLPHTFTYPNAKIRVSNVHISNATAGMIVRVEIGLEGETPLQSTFADNLGPTVRAFVIDAVYEDLPVGIELDIFLNFWVTGGTGTVFNGAALSFLIEEWE